MRETAYTVSELSAELKGTVESVVGQVWIKGEVSGLKAYQSGHWYFTLRDADAQLRCVMWQTYSRRVKQQPVDGTEVYVLARPTTRAAGFLRRSFGRVQLLRSGLIAVMVMWVLGFALNDSGAAIPAVGATLAIPLVIAIALRTLEDERLAGPATTRASRLLR